MRLMILLIPLLAVAVVAAQDNYCFAKDSVRPQLHHLGSKIAYNVDERNKIYQHYQVSGCEPKKFWILQRHGTRTTGSKDTKNSYKLEELRNKIVDNYLHRKPQTDALCPEDLIGIQTWKWNSNITSDMDKSLTEQGRREVHDIAETYQRYYPTLLPKQFNSTYYKFRHTDAIRTKESFEYFAKGLFGENNEAKIADTNVSHGEEFLRGYLKCNSFQESSTKNFRKANSEYDKFAHSALWNKTIEDISSRLGFSQGPLTLHEALLIYDTCRFEQAWNVNSTSVWCAVFRPEELKVFEYTEELVNYYGSGYGFDEHRVTACNVVQDMLVHLANPVSPHAVGYFAHSPNIQLLITALGIAEDDFKLRADNYESTKNRLWKLSVHTPFAANFAAIKYDCPAAQDKEKVVFFLNQEAVQFSWCNNGVCKLSEIQKRFKNFYDADCPRYHCPPIPTTPK